MSHISLSPQTTIQAFQTETFNDCYNELDKESQKKTKALINEITQNPIRNSEIMKSDYAGLRKKRKGRVRILYAYCKDCRERGDNSNRACASCKDTPNESIVFFYVGLKGIIYEDN